MHTPPRRPTLELDGAISSQISTPRLPLVAATDHAAARGGEQPGLHQLLQRDAAAPAPRWGLVYQRRQVIGCASGWGTVERSAVAALHVRRGGWAKGMWELTPPPNPRLPEMRWPRRRGRWHTPLMNCAPGAPGAAATAMICRLLLEISAELPCAGAASPPPPPLVRRPEQLGQLAVARGSRRSAGCTAEGAGPAGLRDESSEFNLAAGSGTGYVS